MNPNDVSIDESIASSAGADANRRRHQQQHVTWTTQHLGASPSTAPSSQRGSAASGVSRNSSSLLLLQQQQLAAAAATLDTSVNPREWRNVPEVIVRSITGMDRKLSLILQHQLVTSAAAMSINHNTTSSNPNTSGVASSSAATLNSTSRVSSAYRDAVDNTSNIGIVQPQQHLSARHVPREAVAAQQRQVETHYQQQNHIHGEQQSQARSQQHLAFLHNVQSRVKRTSPERQEEAAHTQKSQKSAALDFFCVTTHHANNVAPSSLTNDLSLFGIQGPRSRYGTDQQDGDKFYAAHRKEFAALEAEIAKYQQQQHHHQQPPRSARKSPSPVNPGTEQSVAAASLPPSSPPPVSPGGWAQRIQQVRMRQQQTQQQHPSAVAAEHDAAAGNVSPLSSTEDERSQQLHHQRQRVLHQEDPRLLEQEEEGQVQEEAEQPQPQQSQHDEADRRSEASNSSSAAVIVAASRPKLPDVMQAVLDVDKSSSSSEGAAGEQQPQQKRKADDKQKPPLAPSSSNAGGVKSQRQQEHEDAERAAEMSLRILQLKQTSNNLRNSRKAMQELISVNRADSSSACSLCPCRWQQQEQREEEEEENTLFVRCGPPQYPHLFHRADAPRRLQTSIDGISARTSLDLTKTTRLHREDDDEKKELAAAAEAKKRILEREAADEKNKKRQAVESNELQLAALWRRPAATSPSSTKTNNNNTSTTDENDPLTVSTVIKQQAERARKTEQQQRELLERLKHSEWRLPSGNTKKSSPPAEREIAPKKQSPSPTPPKQQPQQEQPPSFRSWVFRTSGEVSLPCGAAAWLPCSVREQDFAVCRNNSNYINSNNHNGKIAEPTIANPRSEAPLHPDSSKVCTVAGENSRFSNFIVRWCGFKGDASQRGTFVAVSAATSQPSPPLVRLAICLFSPRAEIRSARHAGVRSVHGVASWRVQVRVNGEVRDSVVVVPREIVSAVVPAAGDAANVAAILSCRIDLDVFHGDQIALELRKVSVSNGKSSNSPFRDKSTNYSKSRYETGFVGIHEIPRSVERRQLFPPSSSSSLFAAAAVNGLVDTPRGKSLDFRGDQEADGENNDDDNEEFRDVWFAQFVSRD